MSDWNAEISFLEPQFTERDNLGRGRRLSLRQINVVGVATKPGQHTARTKYELTFNVDDSGVVRLSKIERGDNGTGQIHLHTLALCLAEAEAAVGAWINQHDASNLALVPADEFLASHEADAAPITNEAEAKSEAEE